MPDTSPRLELPYLMPSQAQKHVTHNEALQRLDTLVQMVVLQLEATIPPTLPEAGDGYALGHGTAGAWVGQDDTIAIWNGTAWIFYPPAEGWLLWDHATASLRVRTEGAWKRPHMETDNLEGLGVGIGSDSVNRLAVSSPASLFSHDGDGHQLKVNKSATAGTASIVFQSNWSGHAEMGLMGSDAFSIKVSADGTTWNTAMHVDEATGHIGIGTLPAPDRQLAMAGDGRIDGNLTVNGSCYLDGVHVQAFDGGTVGSLVAGSDFGTLIEGTSNGHLVLGIRENNGADSVTILSGQGNYNNTSTYNTTVAVFQSGGNVGFGVANPQRNLHLNDTLRLSPSAPPANPAAGDIYFDDTAMKLRCHDGTSWRDLF